MDLLELLALSNKDDVPIWNETVLIAITARSGSTAICRALADAGAAREIGEVLNPRGPFPWYHKQFGGDNLIQYLNAYYENNQLLGKLVFKTAFTDLKPVLESHRIDKLLPGLRVIYIDRADKVEQAVSLYRAKLTSVWHRDVSENAEPVPRCELSDYDFSRIDQDYTNLKLEAANWEKFFKKVRINPERVEYEEFADNPRSVLARLVDFVGGLGTTGEFVVKQLKIGDELNILWADMFRRDLERMKAIV